MPTGNERVGALRDAVADYPHPAIPLTDRSADIIPRVSPGSPGSIADADSALAGRGPRQSVLGVITTHLSAVESLLLQAATYWFHTRASSAEFQLTGTEPVDASASVRRQEMRHSGIHPRRFSPGGPATASV